MQAQDSLTCIPMTELGQPVAELPVRGANITDPLEKNPWGITQFTVQDLDGNVFYFHGD